MEDSNLVDMEEEEELDEWLRNALISCLPFLKTKVKLFARQKENRLKVKVDEMKDQLAEKTIFWRNLRQNWNLLKAREP